MAITGQRIWEWTGVNEVQSREAEREEPRPGEVEVRLKAIGICGTDLHIMSGHVQFGMPPMPLGHELAGVVERVGPGAHGWQPGDRVCVDPLVGCGSCEACRHGRKHHCPHGVEIGLHLPGGWRSYMNVPAANLYRLPDALDFAEATQAETLHCCVGGVDKLDIAVGAHATVIGDGPTGLLFVQLLKAAGCGHVTLLGRRDKRLQLGRQLGADVVLSADGDPMPQLEEAFDIVIDAAGTESSIASALTLLRRGGQLLMFGLPGQPVIVDVQALVMKELRMIGSTNAPHVWPRVLELMASGMVQVKPLFTQEYPFDRMDQALALARSKPDEVIKVIVTI